MAVRKPKKSLIQRKRSMGGVSMSEQSWAHIMARFSAERVADETFSSWVRRTLSGRKGAA